MKSKKLLSVLLLLTLLCSCGGKTTLDIDSAVDALHASDAFAEPMSEVEVYTACMMYRLSEYGVQEADLVQARVFIPETVISDEMAFFETSSEALAKSLFDALTARVSTQSAAFAGYGPEQVPKLERATIKQDGCFVYLIVATNYDAVSAISALK